MDAAAEGDAVHLQLAGEDGGLAAIAGEEMAQGHGLELVVDLAVGHAGCGFLVEPCGQEGVEIGGRDLRGRRREAEIAGEMMREDDGAAGDGGGVLEGVAQFANIARPVMALQQLEGGGGELKGPAGRDGSEEEGGKGGKIRLALRERRQANLEDVEAVVEILPEAACADFVADGFIGGGDETEIDAQILAATHAGECLLLDHAQEPGLDSGGNVSDFIKKEGPAVSPLDMAGPCEERAGKGAFLVAEEFCLQKRLWQ